LKHAGESGQLFGSEQLNEWKIQASRTKLIYLQDLEKYKKTDEYREHQQYLVGFKVERSLPLA
jgi:hypothetical protein